MPTLRFATPALRWAARLGCLAAALPLTPADARTVSVASPDGKLQATLSDDNGALRYWIVVDGHMVLAPSPLGLQVNDVELGDHAAIGAVRRGRVDQRYPFRGGKAWATDHANTLSVSLTSHGRAFDADLHVADDGVGVRLRLPAMPDQAVQADHSGWQLASRDPQVWADPLDPGYEAPYSTTTLRGLADGLHGLPITAKVDRYWLTLSEAAVVDFGDSAVERDADGMLRTRLYADPKGWHTDRAIVQPWRVTIVARDLTGLVNSTLVQNLNPPPTATLATAAWIRAGVSSWQWLAVGAPIEAEQHQWVDWTKALGYPYYLVDEGWAEWKRPWESLEDTVRYARSQGVGIWVWMHSKEVVDPAVRRALLHRLAALGVVGVKIDFPEPDSRAWSNWYADTARDAAAERLMVDFHGAAKPTGTERTWPNVLTREGVRGHEWQITRYHRTLPPAHDTILPFTRYVVGPGDYTPTVFEPKELQGNSWAHELAQAIIFTSPFLTMGGDPRTYLENPALDVLKAIPATWDETIVLPGSEPGTMAGFARRHGRDWFIGVMNGAGARPLTVDLSFLGKGKWTLTSLSDDPARPDAFVRTDRTTLSTASIAASLRGQGGFVGWLRPVR